MDKRVKLVVGNNKEICTQMESEGAKNYYDTDIPRQVWNEKVFMHLPHVQYLTLVININALEEIRNTDFF